MDSEDECGSEGGGSDGGGSEGGESRSESINVDDFFPVSVIVKLYHLDTANGEQRD